MCYILYMDTNEIKKLADLARIDMNEEEMAGIAKDFQSILAYVGQVQEVSGEASENKKSKEDYFMRNVMREDAVTNNGRENTDKILANAPEVEDGFIKVRKIM
ncbi:MAG: Asp-tRNA(Asn)/Glu-tRNA(Gln) amidotransferase subunit GatC [Candidatus Moranbacteria bacterium]|nr:Asp-tRNA(Asn)/Glu-tRNA(Gln) amidotransferase subunit GatC [Candidatus Moranbacteria bacterium]